MRKILWVRKAPKGSGFPWLVPVEAVWDSDQARKETLRKIAHTIQDSLPLWAEHTVDVLLQHFATSVTQVEKGQVARNVRDKVADIIGSVAGIPEKTRQTMLGILDNKPSLEPTYKPEKERPFPWTVEEFLLEGEKQAIVDFIKEVEYVVRDEDITLRRPRESNWTRILEFHLPGGKKGRIELRKNYEKVEMVIRNHKKLINT